jgi:surfeit locus 1 family protein
VLAPARLAAGGLVVVNRGFVPEGRRDPRSRPEGETTGAIDLIGVLRWPEQRGVFAPKDEPERNLWFVRDPAAIAAAKGWGEVAPFYVELEGPQPPGGLPRAGALKPNLRNEHLQYAITWYGLAVVVAVMFSFWLRSHRVTHPVSEPFL